MATISAAVANPKLSQFRRARYALCPAVFRINVASGDVYNQRRRVIIIPPRAFAGGVSGDVVRDAGASLLVVAGAYGLISGFDYLTQRRIVEQNLSRKLVHILSGLLYMGCWPIFSTSTDARYFAALVPLLNCARLLVHGLSLVTNEDLIKSVTREGKPEELLRGPLYYVLMLILSTVVFWRESPIGVVSISMMCGGDGIADIMGRRFGIHKLPYNKNKSWVGSISMFTVGFLISIGMLYYFSIFGSFELDWWLTIERVAVVALVATLVESFPTKGGLDDNISVPLGNVYCHHDLIAVSRIAGQRSSRNGDEFYGCRLWPNQDCKMFMWRKDFDVFLKEYSSRRDQEIKEMQIENLKLKNMVLEEENKNLKLQLSLKRSNWKSNVVLGLAIVVIALWWIFV